MRELHIDVGPSPSVPNAVAIVVRGKDDNGNPVCLYYDDVTKPTWWERLLHQSWSYKVSKSYERAEKILRGTLENEPILDRILSPYQIRNQK